MTATIPAEVLRRIQAIVGDKGVITDPAEMAPYLHEERGLFVGRTPMIVRPADTREVAAVLALCAEAKVAVVPQGGNTGLMGGAIPEAGQILLNLSRLNRVRAIDPENFTMTVEAGCILAQIQEAAAEAGCLFPLSLAAEGSCQIGGNISTNAGGNAVLRFGNTRDLILGLEVVLADGTVWDGLRSLRKDNTGYDLKQLFIGSEGTLGIVTAAVLKLYPRPRDVQTALVALGSPAAAVELLGRARAASGDAVTAFELIPRLGLDFVTRHIAGAIDPFEGRHPWYVLVELSSPQPEGALREGLETFLGQAFEDELIQDAVLAESEQQRRQLWHLRESLPESQKHEGGSIKHDVAVPVSRVAQFLERAIAAVEAEMPGIRVCAFGHVGDGNIHFNLSQPEGADKAEYLAQWARMNRVVHDIVVEMNGSISAEHGIGKLKRDELAHYKSPVEIALMRKVKAALDPDGILNPGKVV